MKKLKEIFSITRNRALLLFPPIVILIGTLLVEILYSFFIAHPAPNFLFWIYCCTGIYFLCGVAFLCVFDNKKNTIE